MDQYTRKIARMARRTLGRRARRTAGVDWPAVEAVKAAAAEIGLAERLCQWVQVGDASLEAIARSFVCRYVQAYGPVGNLIDAGAHVGSSRPIVVEV